MKSLAILFFSIFFISNIYAAIPTNLTKVKNEHPASCVAYYIYQGERYCATQTSSIEPIDPHVKTYEMQNLHYVLR